MTPDEQRPLIEAYSSATSDRLVAALDRLPRELWQARPSPDDWTVHEIAVHLCDSEANSYVRLRKAIAEPGGAVAAFDEQRWQAALGSRFFARSGARPTASSPLCRTTPGRT